VLLLNISTTNKPVPPRIAEVFNEFPQAALLWLRFILNFHLHPGHRLWFGQFQFQPDAHPDASSGNHTLAYSSSNSQPVTIYYPHAGAIQCGNHRPRG